MLTFMVKSGGQKKGGGGAAPLDARSRRLRNAAAIWWNRLSPFRLRAILDRQPLEGDCRRPLCGVSVPESIRFPVGRKSDGVLTLVVRAPMHQ
jgi:hypothetical protein